MKDQSKFSAHEWSGRTIFHDVLTSSTKTDEYYFTEDKYCPIDVVWKSNNSLNTGEIKFRVKYSSTDKIIQDGGVVLEKWKYDNLKQTQNISGATPYYIMEFNDGVGYLWDISELKNVNWVNEENKFPKTTCGDTTKTTKAVTYLPLSKGKKFKWDTTKKYD